MTHNNRYGLNIVTPQRVEERIDQARKVQQVGSNFYERPRIN
jgi:hypothetical protein